MTTRNKSDDAASDSGVAVTHWINDLRLGNAAAATRLWNYLEPRLLNLGKLQMRSTSTACYDEEDLAQSAFHALCESIQLGKYEGLSGRDELWKLLVTITLNKFRNRMTHNNAQRRGGHMQRKDIDVILNSESSVLSAEQSLMLQEECQQLLETLGSDEIRKVALLKVEGYTNEQIANTLQCTRRTVQRRLDFIRTVWSRDIESA